MKQDYTAVSKEILEYLFDGYLRDGGTKTYKLSEVIMGHGFSLTEVGNHLITHRWIKNAEFRPSEFSAAISIGGIKKIRQNWLDTHLAKIMDYFAVKEHKTASVMEILEFKLNNFQIALDIARASKSNGFIEIDPPDSDIISLNQEGLMYYEKKG